MVPNIEHGNRLAAITYPFSKSYSYLFQVFTGQHDERSAPINPQNIDSSTHQPSDATILHTILDDDTLSLFESPPAPHVTDISGLGQPFLGFSFATPSLLLQPDLPPDSPVTSGSTASSSGYLASVSDVDSDSDMDSSDADASSANLQTGSRPVIVPRSNSFSLYCSVYYPEANLCGLETQPASVHLAVKDWLSLPEEEPKRYEVAHSLLLLHSGFPIIE